MSRPALPSGARRRRIALLLPALTLLTALSAAGIPALVARSQTSSLQQSLSEATPADRSMLATGDARPFEDSSGTFNASALDNALNEYAAQVPAAAAPERALAWDGAQVEPALPLLAQGTDATIDLQYRGRTSPYLHLISGTMPSRLDFGSSSSAPTEFDVALSAPTAKLYGVKAGSVITLKHDVLRVTGIFAATDPSSDFWYSDGFLANPSYVKTLTGSYWATGALVGPAEVAGLYDASADDAQVTISVELGVPLVTSGYRALDAGSLVTGLNGFDTGLVPTQFHLDSSAGPINVLTSFQQQRQSIDAILGLVMCAVAVTGAITMLLSMQLVVAGRRRHWALLRARGQSHVQLALHSLVRLGLVNLAATALAGAAARLASPADWTTLSTVLLAAVGAMGLFGPSVVALVDLRGRSGGRAERRDLVRRRDTPRRRVLELLVLLLAAAAVFELRHQGLGGPQQGSNVLGTLTPVLVAALATVVAVRCYPLLLRPAERTADRRGGPVSFLGLAGASRSALPLAAPAFVITLTLTLAALGGLMDLAVESGRVTHSWQTIGADGVVTLPEGTGWSTAAKLDAALAGVPGVTHVTMAADQADFTTNSQLFVVDPATYAAVAADTPWPLAPGLPPRAVPGPVPILVAPGSGHTVGSTLKISPAYGPAFQARIAGYVGQTPAAPNAPASNLSLVLVPSWAVAGNTADWPASQILVSGKAIDESAMSAVVRASLPGATTAYRADILGQYTHAPLTGLAELGYAIGLVIAGVFGLCAILLSLGLSAPARERRLTLLNTLGLTPRQARGIALTETIPLMAATVLAGLLAAASMPAVFGDALDLSAFTGLPGPSGLGFEPGIALLAALAAALLTALAVALQAAAAYRRPAGTELRMGEEAEA